MLKKSILFAQLVIYVVQSFSQYIGGSLRIRFRRFVWSLSRSSSTPAPQKQRKAIVIVGASFAGYQAAYLISGALHPDGDYEVVVIEPNSHFQFTWILPRLCVVPDHEHKAFIPYGPYLGASLGTVRWVRDKVVRIERDSVEVRSGEKIPYAFLVLATGSMPEGELPSRVGSEGRSAGIEKLKGMQARIRDAKSVVVVGGGAAGVELAADTKGMYPEKDVTLVHSRAALMHRFGPELQSVALKGLETLGVTVILEERAVRADREQGELTLRSGRVIPCDLQIDCTGQKPASNFFASLSPACITETGHIKRKPTMQVADDTLPNIYVCGDVAENDCQNPNSRAALKMASVVADNVLLAAAGKPPTQVYRPHWGDGVIKLTLGMSRSVTQFGDQENEIFFSAQEKDVALNVAGVWKYFGVKPFDHNVGYSTTQ